MASSSGGPKPSLSTLKTPTVVLSPVFSVSLSTFRIALKFIFELHLLHSVYPKADLMDLVERIEALVRPSCSLSRD